MARVYIKNDDKWVDVPDGSKLVALNGQCSIVFACEEGVCGSCLSTILEGAENLEAPSDKEKEMIQMFGGKENQRLLCQAVIKGGEVKIEQ